MCGKTLYHATYVERIPSILQHGLGGIDPGPNAEACERGVYLSDDPHLAMLMLVDHDRIRDAGGASSLASDRYALIVIDVGRYDPAQLDVDPHFDDRIDARSFRYSGVIDVTGLQILNLQQVLGAQ